MKKSILFPMMTAAFVGLAACGGGDDRTGTTADPVMTPGAETTPGATTAPGTTGPGMAPGTAQPGMGQPGMYGDTLMHGDTLGQPGMGTTGTTGTTGTPGTTRP